MFFVYILRATSNGNYYIGSTENLEKRVEEHNNNKTQSLKGKGSFVVIYYEKCPNRKSAVKRERQIKSYKGGNAFKALIGKKYW